MRRLPTAIKRNLLAVLCLLSIHGSGSLVAQPAPEAEASIPIVFVHGNGDDAAKWVPIIWLFESNGYPADRLHAIRFSNPSSRSDDRRPQAHRSSTVDQVAELSAFVSRVLLSTGARKVALVGSSRGGLTIRNYLRNAGGAAVTSHAILCGAPNHGVYALPANPGNEFNGSGDFLRRLNEGPEVVDGVAFLTLRSDRFDKYAQPDGRAAGMPIERTGVDFDGPALDGATNIVLPGLDHREVAFHPDAFREMYRFLTASDPQTLEVLRQPQPRMSGLLTGFADGVATNLPLAGVRLRIFALDPDSAAREPLPAYEHTTSEDGAWGPFVADPARHYEFLIEHDGRSVSIFKSPLVRGTSLLNLRFYPPSRKLPPEQPSLLVHRPQGYFSKERDPVQVNGNPAAGIPDGLPVEDSFVITHELGTGLQIELRNEMIVARPARVDDGHYATAEFFWE
jgi:triacylglycerol lipase